MNDWISILLIFGLTIGAVIRMYQLDKHESTIDENTEIHYQNFIRDIRDLIYAKEFSAVRKNVNREFVVYVSNYAENQDWIFANRIIQKYKKFLDTEGVTHIVISLEPRNALHNASFTTKYGKKQFKIF